MRHETRPNGREDSGRNGAFVGGDGLVLGKREVERREVFEGARKEPRGRYELLRVVNRGGMGEIALARVTGTKGFEKLVVLKRLRADAEREDHIAMFDVEQEVMSRIEHPNIVKVFDQPVIDDTPYLAMEYIRGRNLDQVVRAAYQLGQELSVSFCLSAISEVLRGLAFVHRLKDNEGRALGVVHQDMTPSNVLVSFFGEVKITDFGISYVTSRDGGLRKGVLKGKPRYVAPEVLAGKRVNNTADIYGVGVVLYELFTGRALFARPTVKETLAAVARNELPDFDKELGHLGEGVPRLLERALQKDPQDRYRTAEAMAADILNELAKRGGAMPAAMLGQVVRQLFPDDPDVPEMDPALEQAIAMGSVPASATMMPVDLDETLSALDRLLGKEKSTDLFSVPEELQGELSEFEDMDPFLAQTPLPDFIWDAKNEQEVLERAEMAFGPQGLVSEPKPLFSGPENEPRGRPPSSIASPEAPQPIPSRTPGAGAYSQVNKPNGSLDIPFATPEEMPRPPVASMARATVETPAPRAVTPKPQIVVSPAIAPVAEPPTTSSMVLFWLGLALGLVAGAALGALYL